MFARRVVSGCSLRTRKLPCAPFARRFASSSLARQQQQQQQQQFRTRWHTSLLLCGGTIAAATAFATLMQDPAESKGAPRVFAWGSSQYGQTGLGAESMGGENLPQPIKSLNEANIVQLAAGAEHCVALAANGDVYTWGRGQFKVLGHGSESSVASPQLVDDLDAKIVQIDAGEMHTVALDEAGQVWTWGKHALGHTGKGMYPGLVKGLEGVKVTQVCAGSRHTLAVTEKGELYAWGKGFDGALGLGDKNDRNLPVLVSALAGKRVTQVAAGMGFTLILTAEGRVYSCGNSDYGQLGQGSDSERYERTPVMVRALRKRVVTRIAAGDYHAVCCTNKGEVYTWGLGMDGQMGSGETAMHNPQPRQVKEVKDAKQVGAGGGHTGAITGSGQLLLWGRGRYGQLGRADELESVAAYRASPVQVGFFDRQRMRVVALALGRDFTAAIAESK